MEAPISGSLGALNSLLGKLDYLLQSQQLFRKPVRKDIVLLKEDLERISTFVLEITNEDEPNQTKKYWMKEVREVSYDIEDYIDRLVYSEAKIRSVGIVPRLKIRKLPSTLNRRPKIASQIQELRVRLQDAGERHKRYVQDNNTPASCSYVPFGHSTTTLNEEASRLLVGIDDSREKLVRLLNDGEKQLKVISVFGIGGIGKTTLVKQIFEDHAGQFGFRAFVRVSRKPDTTSVLRSIILQTRCHHHFDPCNVEELILCLNEHLQDRRYLIVIDDLWDTTVWDILLRAFSDGNHSSRIITTTAVKNVAMTCCGDRSDYVITMEPLNINDSRKLFFTRVFGSEDKCPQQFKDASYGIVKNCGGVPLAIINIAGFLASQPDKPDLWDYVQKSSLGSNLSICPTTEGIVNVINLGYNGLPNCLRTCLQYVTLYPENCTILKDDLVRRWVAEGFISPKEGNDMEAVAESYFEELVYRGMVQPVDINYNDKVLSCTVHNLVLDLLIRKSTEDNFVTTIDYSKNNRDLSNRIRRLFLFFSTVKYAAKPSGVTLSQVRSLAFYGLIKCMPSIMEFEFLRVLFLHFSGDYSGHTPFNLTGICRLFQLRYLKVTCNFSLKLPTHIEGLYHLETLELDAKVTPLPADIIYLEHLLHLRLPSETNLPEEMGRMRSLLTLKCFDLSINSEDKIRSLEELTNLQELQLICTTVPSESLDRNLNVLFSILGSFCSLKSLSLVPWYSVICSSTSVIDSSSTSSPPVCLERFEMHPSICTFSGFPEWIRTLSRLCILKIAVNEFLRDDMDILGGLPGLKVLSLYARRPTVDLIVFKSGVFPSLKYFKFRCITLRFTFLDEAMPNLRRLKLCFKSDRGITLDGIVHLQNLREVALTIGLAAGEYNRQPAESASMVAEPFFKVTNGEHIRIPNLDIQYVKWDDEDYEPGENISESARHLSHEILEETLRDDSNKYSDIRISRFADMTISSSDLVSSASPSPEFRYKEFEDRCHKVQEPKFNCLLFDLDGTLYPLSSGIAGHIKKNTEEYMVEKLGIDESKIENLCNLLYKNYGTTMAGLGAIGYSFDYDEYHAFVYGRLPYYNIKPDPALKQILKNLHIRKFIFTNSDKLHALRALKRLGLEDCFEGIICFETLNPPCPPQGDQEPEIFDIAGHFARLSTADKLPKTPVLCMPNVDAMKEALLIANINPHKAIFFDDSVRNIQAGKKVGLHTVLVGTSQRLKGADYALASIHNIVEALPELWEEAEKAEGVLYADRMAIETFIKV